MDANTAQMLNELLSTLGNFVDKDALLYFKQKVDALYARKASIPTKISQLTNDSGFQTSAQVNTIIDGKGFLKAIPDEYVTDTELTTKGYQTAAQVNTTITGKGYQTSAQVETAITGKNYQTAPQVETTITGKGYQTNAQVQTIVNNAVGKITSIDFQVVASLPATGVKGVIYLVSNSGAGNNVYDEFIWVTTKYEKIGTTDVDLSNYYNASNFVAVTNAEIDAMF